MGFGETTQQYLIHDGPDEPSRQLLLAAGIWQNDLHEEIYVFNQGFGTKTIVSGWKFRKQDGRM